MNKFVVVLMAVFVMTAACSAALVSSFEHGTSYYSQDGVDAKLDFAVYDDPAEFFSQTGHNSPGSGDYIYAYQIYNETADASKAIDSFTLFDGNGQSLAGLLPDATSMDDGNGGIQPGSVDGGSWVWTNEHGLIAKDDHSWLLVFTSNAGPTRGSYEVTAVSVEDQDPPVPGDESSDPPSVPEPASIALLGLGGLFFRKKRTINA